MVLCCVVVLWWVVVCGVVHILSGLACVTQAHIKKGKTDYHDHCTVVAVIAFPFLKGGSRLPWVAKTKTHTDTRSA